MRLLLPAAVLLALPTWVQNGPPPHVRAAIQSIERMLEGRGDDTLETFAAERLTPAYRGSFAPGALLAHLSTMRGAVGGSRRAGGGRVRDARGAARAFASSCRVASPSGRLGRSRRTLPSQDRRGTATA